MISRTPYSKYTTACLSQDDGIPSIWRQTLKRGLCGARQLLEFRPLQTLHTRRFCPSLRDPLPWFTYTKIHQCRKESILPHKRKHTRTHTHTTGKADLQVTYFSYQAERQHSDILSPRAPAHARHGNQYQQPILGRSTKGKVVMGKIWVSFSPFLGGFKRKPKGQPKPFL